MVKNRVSLAAKSPTGRIDRGTARLMLYPQRGRPLFPSRSCPMKHSPLVGVLLVALCGCQAKPQSRELEKLVQDKLNALKEVTATLKTVTDAKTAQAALVKMD